MTIRFRCSGCSVVLTTTTRKPGDEVRCPRCQQSQVIPATESDRKSLFAPETEIEGTLSELKPKFSEDLFEKAPSQQSTPPKKPNNPPTQVGPKSPSGSPKPPPLPSTSSRPRGTLPNKQDSLEDIDEPKSSLPTDNLEQLKLLLAGAKIAEFLENKKNNNTTPELIPEKDINVDIIESILLKASIFAIKFQNELVTIHINRVFISMSIYDSSCTIRFLWMHKFKAGKTGIKKLRMLNQINNEFMFMRFFMTGDNDDSLQGDYYLSYDGGLYAHQIVDCVILFYSCVNKILTDFDNEELLDD